MDQALDGMYVEAGMNLYKMADLTTIWVDVEVFEHQVEAMRVGQRARRSRLPYRPARPYTGFVRYLYPHFDERTRTMTVSIELENPDLTLRAGMYANVTFDVPVARNALAVAEEAVIRGGTRDLVVLERSPGTFQVAAVTLGRQGGGVWEVLEGVEEGDTVVVSAQFLIDSESNLTQAIRSIESGPDMSGMPAEHAHGAEPAAPASAAPGMPGMPACRRSTCTARNRRWHGRGTGRPAGGAGRPPPLRQPPLREETDARQGHRVGPSRTASSSSSGAVFVAFGGVYALRATPLDALPDLSDVQVIVFTPTTPGRPPRSSRTRSPTPSPRRCSPCPSATVVRGYSFFGFSFVYVIFEDGTDLYWARSRVLEYLNYVSGRLPRGVTPTLGPDATGVGWAYMYALRSDDADLAELRSLQDWFLKYELTAVPGVSEVASIGGFVKQYQITVDPNRLRAPNDIPAVGIRDAVERSNNDVGGRVLEIVGGRVHGARPRATSSGCRRREARRPRGGTSRAPRSRSRTSPRCRSAPTSAAGSPSWTARARWSGGHRRGALRRQRPRGGRAG